MKGQSMYPLAGAVIMITIIALARLSIFSFGPLIESRANLAADMSANEYALELSEMYLNTALKYSFYQACSEVLSKGGRVSEERGDLASEEEFINNLEKRTLAYLNVYTANGAKRYEFIDLSYAVLPEYDSVSIDSDLDDVYIGAETEKQLEAKAEHKITKEGEKEESTIIDTLRRPAALSVQVKSECIELFSKAEAGLFSGDMEKKVREEIARWPSEGLFQDSGSIEASMDATFREAVKAKSGETGIPQVNSIEEGEAAIKERLQSISSEQTIDGYLIKFGMEEAQLIIRISQCSTGQTCSFAYSASVRTKFTVGGKGPKHPVFDGKELVNKNMEVSYMLPMEVS